MTEADNARRTICRELDVVNRKGIHARPASLFAKTASLFDSDVVVEKDGRRVSGKTVMGLLTLEAHCGSVLRVTVEGCDAEEAISELADLVASGFDFD